MDEHRPPLPAVWLLYRICHPRQRDIVEGDLGELFHARVRSHGARYASARYLADVVSLLQTPFSRTHRNRAQRLRERATPTESLMTIIQDLRHAARSLIKTPGFSAVVVVTLGLAIGANSAIFSVVDGVLLKPLAFDDPEQIVLINETMADMGGDGGPEGASQSLYLEWRDNGRALTDIAMYSNEASTITSLEEPARINGATVSPSLFPLLRVDAMVGRVLAVDEELPGKDDVVVIGHRLWQRLYGGDPGLVGQRIELDDRPRTVVGIMPAGFSFPDAGAEYWVPMLATAPEGSGEDAAASAARAGQRVRETREERRGGPGGPGGPDGARGGPDGPGPEQHMELYARVVARLAPGVTAVMAAEEGTRVAQGLQSFATDGDQRGVEVLSMQEQMVGSVRRSLLTLLGAVGFVLLIACANVANLVMARSVERRKETAVRAALGAGWWSLTRLLFIESLLLAGAGAVLGLTLAYGALALLAATGPEFIPRLDAIAIDGRALAFALVVMVLTAVLFSIIPARRARLLDLTTALKEEFGNRAFAQGLGRDALRKLLVMIEVAASVVLLVGAGLLVTSFLALTSVDMGYDPDNLLHIQLQLPATAYSDAASHLDYYDRLVALLEGLPGVEAATVTNQPPNVPANIRVAISVQTAEPAPGQPERRPEPIGVRMVENGYFDALRAQPAEGRFMNRDDRPETLPVAVLSRSGVAAMFGETNPVGERIDFIGGQQIEIVGIAEDIRTAGVDPRPQPDLFLPYRQAPGSMVPMLFRTAHVLVRTGPAPLELLPAIRTQIRQIDPGVVLLSAATMRDRLAESVAEPRFYASLVVAFAALALTLAAVGIYGMLSYTVQQGIRDTAIRRALGAPVGQILRRVVSQGMVLAAIGLVVGVVASIALGRVLESMLYEISTTDPGSFAVVVVVFLAVALLAVWIPARRATRIDPMDVLRYQ